MLLGGRFLQIIELGRIIILLEEYYKKLFNSDIGIDIEWALDGIDNKFTGGAYYYF